jgi:hypothetical protein
MDEKIKSKTLWIPVLDKNMFLVFYLFSDHAQTKPVKPAEKKDR